MKKIRCAALLLVVLAFAGCMQTELHNSDTATGPVPQQITAWPENKYTETIPEPQKGSPDYVISDEEKGYYAIFMKDITAEEGKDYLRTLEADGYQQIEAAENEASAGVLLKREQTHLSVSIAEGILGLYITLVAS